MSNTGEERPSVRQHTYSRRGGGNKRTILSEQAIVFVFDYPVTLADGRFQATPVKPSSVHAGPRTSAQLSPVSRIERKSRPENLSRSSLMPLVTPMIGVSLRAARSKPRYRSAVFTSRLLLRTAVASESIFQTRPRRCAPKSAPTDDVSELPFVPTNEAPTWASQRGGGGGGAGA